MLNVYFYDVHFIRLKDFFLPEILITLPIPANITHDLINANLNKQKAYGHNIKC